MDQTLEQRRVAAAEASGGTSSDEIKDLVLRLIRANRLAGSVLDFGAGTGELIQRLLPLGIFSKIGGADILERPPGLPDSVDWYRQDLNAEIAVDAPFDVVICSEVIEHLENPRAVFRNVFQLLKPGGTLVLTTPNQECLRSYVGLLFGGHFVHFLGVNYPAHITALLRTDLVRIAAECGFLPGQFHYTNVGGIPKLPSLKWQHISFGLLRGRPFSDNLGFVVRKPGSALTRR